MYMYACKPQRLLGRGLLAVGSAKRRADSNSGQGAVGASSGLPTYQHAYAHIYIYIYT